MIKIRIEWDDRPARTVSLDEYAEMGLEYLAGSRVFFVVGYC